MNNWQNWAVALILLLCIVRIGQSIYSFFRGVKEKRNPCANCATGCELKTPEYLFEYSGVFFFIKSS